ncbi:MAG: hypothetical protein QG591_2575 [Planctomycetota bacterium]|nr:hypothetical protein [Planctomycetota bacterium]
MKTIAFRLPSELAELSLQALRDGHRIKLSTLLKPIPSREELAEEAVLWAVADEIEK